MSTIHPPTITAASSCQPEFADTHGIKRIFGISRSFAYDLLKHGKIRSISLRKPGRAKGRRLFDVASVRDFLRSQED